MVECQICHQSLNMISWKHLLKHNTNLDQYKNQFPDSPVRSQEVIERKKLAATQANAMRLGVPRSKETINKIKASKATNPKTAWNKGVARTEQQNSQLSETRKQKFRSGEIVHWNTGKLTPNITKQKISETALNQHRAYAEESKAKRELTIAAKIKSGWIHHSTLRQGATANFSDDALQKIRTASKQSNQLKKMKAKTRLYDHLLPYDLNILNISDNGYTVTMLCNKCNTQFSRTASVLTPYRYQLYDGKYCPTCYPIYTGYYSDKYFEDRPEMKDIQAVFYVAVFHSISTQEQFGKIGITTRSASDRLSQETTFYDVDILVEIQMSLFEAYKIEQLLLSDPSRQKHTPARDFGGKTECFNLSWLGTLAESIQDISG